MDIFIFRSFLKLLQRIFIKSWKSDAVVMVQNGHFYFQVFFGIVAADFFQKFENRCSGDGAKWTFLFSRKIVSILRENAVKVVDF